MNICVVIPTFNESRAIGGLVTRIRNAGYDVIVVDDGSLDKTVDIARESGAFVITHKENQGKGATLKQGFAYAIGMAYDAVVIMDGDGQHNPKDIPRFVEAAESSGADMVIGNRMENARSMPAIRWMTNKWMSNSISKISGCYIPDTQCGFRLIRRELLEKIKLSTSKYDTESEILIKAGKAGYKMVSIPIKSVYSGEVSTIHPVKDGLRFLRLLHTIDKE